MDKISVVFPKKRNVSFDFGKGDNKQRIIVKPNISLEEMKMIIQAYLSEFFKEGKGQFDESSTNALFAEEVFNIALIDVCTKIDILSPDDEGGASVDELRSSGLLDEVKKRIKDLPILIGMRDRIVQDAMTEQFSFKGMIDSITGLVKDLPNEKLAELKKGVGELQESIGKDSPLGDLFKEA